MDKQRLALLWSQVSDRIDFGPLGDWEGVDFHTGRSGSGTQLANEVLGRIVVAIGDEEPEYIWGRLTPDDSRIDGRIVVFTADTVITADVTVALGGDNAIEITATVRRRLDICAVDILQVSGRDWAERSPWPLRLDVRLRFVDGTVIPIDERAHSRASFPPSLAVFLPQIMKPASQVVPRRGPR